jgi:microcystin-dependent protein
MTYSVSFTDSTNPAKPAITVADGTVNQQTSLGFPGQGYAGYGTIIAGDLLHLLENFANSTAPSNAVQGQLWYDTSSGNNILRVYDGAGNWPEAGSIKREGKSTLTTTGGVPDVTNSNIGDLWVDTDNSQLYLFSGTTWLLIGPQFSTGASTGPLVESIVDTSNIAHSVISLYASSSTNNVAYRVAIISIDSFTPKATIAGFSTINIGINLYNNSLDKGTAFVWGIAQSANALVVGSGSTQATVQGSNFLRSDVVSTTNNAFNIRNAGGLSVGTDLSFTLAQGNNSFIFNGKSSTNNFDFILNGNNLLHLDVSGKVAIGAPTTVSGTITSGLVGTAGGLTVTDGANPVVNGNGVVTDAGNHSIFSVSSTAVTTSLPTTISNTLTLGNTLQISSNAPSGSIFLPPTLVNATPSYDIGSQSQPFRNIFAQSFVGSFTGNFSGSVTGSVTGTASSLSQTITFKLAGDVLSSDGGTGFNGASASGYAVLNTQLSPTVINNQAIAQSSTKSDQLLAYQTNASATGGTLVSMSKTVLLQIDPTLNTSGYGMPVGAIIPWAGVSSIRAIPNGWLLCDGSEVSQSTYQSLFKVIGNTYGTPQGTGTFVLPDLRARMPLGRNNMNNYTEVAGYVEATNGSSNIPTGGQLGAAQWVTGTAAQTVGGVGGNQSAVLNVSNLPQHQHAVIEPSDPNNPGQTGHSHIDPYAEGGVPFNTVPNTYGAAGSASTDGDQYRYYTSSATTGITIGDVELDGTTVSNIGTAFTTMPPYLTINYLIFTGANLS